MIKIVWLCHFSNSEIRGLYPQDNKRYIYKVFRWLLRLPTKKVQVGDYGPWVTEGLKELKKRKDIELHVISPQTNLAAKLYEVKHNNIYYHFFNPNWTLFLMHIIKNNVLWRKMQNSSNYVNYIVKNVKPDIINLIGSENAFHSCAVLDLKFKVPVLVTMQTFYTNPQRLKYEPYANKSKSWYIDGLIHEKCKYFGVGGNLYYDLLMKENPKAIPLNSLLCTVPLIPVEETVKEYDFVDFALVQTNKKGYVDAIKALAIVKQKYSDVRLNIVGNLDFECHQIVNKLIQEKGLQENVIYTPFFKEQIDLFKHIKKSRFAVLPVKMDIISGTILQAMYYELPVVTYKTTGTPLLNKDQKSVLIAELENIDDLANKMLLLMDDENLAQTLCVNAKHEVLKRSDNRRKIDDLIKQYKAIIDNYYKGIPIPNDMLFKK